MKKPNFNSIIGTTIVLVIMIFISIVIQAKVYKVDAYKTVTVIKNKNLPFPVPIMTKDELVLDYTYETYKKASNHFFIRYETNDPIQDLRFYEGVFWESDNVTYYTSNKVGSSESENLESDKILKNLNINKYLLRECDYKDKYYIGIEIGRLNDDEKTKNKRYKVSIHISDML